VTLNCDLLLTSKGDRFIFLPCGPSILSFAKYRIHKIGNKQTEGPTNGPVENIIRPLRLGRLHKMGQSGRMLLQHFSPCGISIQFPKGHIPLI